MAKFKNVSGFRQFVILSGKKTIVGDGRVIEKEEGWIQHGFQQVADDTPVTVVEGVSRLGRTTPLPDTLEELQKRLQEVETSVEKSVSDEATKVTKVSTEIHAEVEELRNLLDGLGEGYNELKGELGGIKELVSRRMEIIKTAINVMESEMDQLYEKGILDPPENDEGDVKDPKKS